jgi:hypothetical protein
MAMQPTTCSSQGRKIFLTAEAYDDAEEFIGKLGQEVRSQNLGLICGKHSENNQREGRECSFRWCCRGLGKKNARSAPPLLINRYLT